MRNIVVGAIFILVSCLSGCTGLHLTPQQSSLINDINAMACVIAEASTTGATAESVRLACALSETMLPDIEKVLQANAAAAKMVSAKKAK